MFGEQPWRPHKQAARGSNQKAARLTDRADEGGPEHERQILNLVAQTRMLSKRGNAGHQHALEGQREEKCVSEEAVHFSYAQQPRATLLDKLFYP